MSGNRRIKTDRIHKKFFRKAVELIPKPSRGGSKAGSGGSKINATPEQQKIINRFKKKLAVGKRGILKWGGDGSKIIEAPTFKQNADGSISYRMVGERTLYSEKSATIGVGDKPERIRTTVSTGKIMKDGFIVRNKNEIKEVVVSKRKSKAR